jgi:RNA polymerase sigma-70 factor (ECF subfamily)
MHDTSGLGSRQSAIGNRFFNCALNRSSIPSVKEGMDPLMGDEKALIRAVLDGDRGAARSLYDQHVRRVFQVAYRLLGDRDQAEEATQDTFVKAFTRLDSFRGESSLGTWLHAIAVSMALTALRKKKRRLLREADLDDASTLTASRAEGDPDLRDRLRQAIDALPEKFKVQVVLHDIEGFTHGEIAQMTGVPEGTCKTRLMGGRAKLREALAAFAR